MNTYTFRIVIQKDHLSKKQTTQNTWLLKSRLWLPTTYRHLGVAAALRPFARWAQGSKCHGFSRLRQCLGRRKKLQLANPLDGFLQKQWAVNKIQDGCWNMKQKMYGGPSKKTSQKWQYHHLRRMIRHVPLIHPPLLFLAPQLLETIKFWKCYVWCGFVLWVVSASMIQLR